MTDLTAVEQTGPASRALDLLFADLPQHLSVEQLGATLGVATKTAYQYLQAGEVPSYRIGTRWLILRDEIREFLAAVRVR